MGSIRFLCQIASVGLLLAASSCGGSGNGGGSVPPPSGTRIFFTTNGSSTRMRCDFPSWATASWYWSDGSLSSASGLDVEKTGLGTGDHAHQLVISSPSALQYFGATSGGGHGNLVTISGLNDTPQVEVLYAYNESRLYTIGRVNNTRLREYHLWGTALNEAAMDQVFADAVASSVTNGTIWCANRGTSASDANRATLIQRGWTLHYQ